MKKVLLTIMAALSIAFLLIGCSPQTETQKETQTGTPGGSVGVQETKAKISPEERKRMDLYLAVMKGAYEKENGGKGFIAVKLDTLEELSDAAKSEILKELTSLSPNVYNFEDVKNDSTKFELDNNGHLIRTFDGALLWVDLHEYDNDKAMITGVSWFGNLGAVFPKYNAWFIKGVWQLSLVSMAIS